VLRSPYEPQARTGKKRELSWFGYRIHMTETCEAPTPEEPHPLHVVVQVQTTVENRQDVEQTPSIQQELAQAELLPSDQIVDAGYVAAELLVSRPMESGCWVRSWPTTEGRAKAGKGFDAAHGSRSLGSSKP
jgi:transposase